MVNIIVFEKLRKIISNALDIDEDEITMEILLL
jgi:hypothetical protein